MLRRPVTAWGPRIHWARAICPRPFHLLVHQGGYGGYGGQGGYSNGAGYGAAHEQGPSNVLRLRGLPFSAGKDDIIAWFSDIAITPPTEEGCVAVARLPRAAPLGRGAAAAAGPGPAESARGAVVALSASCE
jgi:hypothetical protein